MTAIRRLPRLLVGTHSFVAPEWVEIDGADVEDRSFGVTLLADGAELRGVTVRSWNESVGVGTLSAAPVEATVRNVDVRDSDRTGIFVSPAPATFRARQVRVLDTGAGGPAWGATAAQGGRLDARDLEVRRTTGVTAAAVGGGTRMELTDTLLADQRCGTAPDCNTLYVAQGARLDAAGVTLRDNEYIGVRLGAAPTVGDRASGSRATRSRISPATRSSWTNPARRSPRTRARGNPTGSCPSAAGRCGTSDARGSTCPSSSATAPWTRVAAPTPSPWGP